MTLERAAPTTLAVIVLKEIMRTLQKTTLVGTKMGDTRGIVVIKETIQIKDFRMLGATTVVDTGLEEVINVQTT